MDRAFDTVGPALSRLLTALEAFSPPPPVILFSQPQGFQVFPPAQLRLCFCSEVESHGSSCWLEAHSVAQALNSHQSSCLASASQVLGL